MRASRWNLLAILVAGVFILAACAPAAEPTPTPDPAETPDPAATPPPDTEPTDDEFAESITRVLDAQVGLMSNANTDVPTGRLTAWLYDGLYTIDDTLTPVPLLADGECDVTDDEITYTCTIVDNAFFHNGDPITADDVAFSFQLAISPNCTYNPSICITEFVESATAVDELTVEFVMIEPYAPFVTTMLPAIGIESRAVIESAYDDFAGAAEDRTPAELNDLADEIDAAATPEEEDAEPDEAQCEELASEAENILTDAGVEVVERDDEMDACAYAQALAGQLRDVAGALEAEGLDAIAAAYRLLPFQRDPVGSGPYMLTEFRAGESVTMSSFEDYHQGAPPTQTIFWPIFTDVAVAAQALAAGEVDWLNDLTPDARAVVEGRDDIQLAVYNDFGHFEIQYNMHEAIPLEDGTEWQGWFYDRALRKAMQYCIDKPTLVEVATDGNGVPIEADIPPASWAFNTELQAVERDVEEATRFIEEEATVHTWTLGDDGIYVNQDGDRLASLVLVRAGQQDRIDFMNLLADQVRECGIELEVEDADFQTILIPALDWPHIPPGRSEPWHAYFGGWGVGIDPDPYALFHSSQCTSEEVPFTFNYVCFQNERVDELIEAGLRTSDIDERTEIYWEYQEIMAEEQPYLFAWSNIEADALHAGIQYADGRPLELDSPAWGWERHLLVKVENGN